MEYLLKKMFGDNLEKNGKAYRIKKGERERAVNAMQDALRKWYTDDWHEKLASAMFSALESSTDFQLATAGGRPYLKGGSLLMVTDFKETFPNQTQAPYVTYKGNNVIVIGAKKGLEWPSSDGTEKGRVLHWEPMLANPFGVPFYFAAAAAMLPMPEAGPASVTLFRAVSAAEAEQLAIKGAFDASANSLGGKFFAESAKDAAAWGKAMFGDKPFKIVQVEVNANAAGNMLRWTKLDGIGPARYAEVNQLEGNVLKIVELK